MATLKSICYYPLDSSYIGEFTHENTCILATKNSKITIIQFDIGYILNIICMLSKFQNLL